MFDNPHRGDCFRCVMFESHRCSNRWIGNQPCPDGMQYAEYTGSEVKPCILACVEVYQDGYMHCPVMDCYGCEYCYEQLDADDYIPLGQNHYKRLPRWTVIQNIERNKSMKKSNKRCPLQPECGMTCIRVGEEKECAYYQANQRPGYEIPDQENAPGYGYSEPMAGVGNASEAEPSQNQLVYISIDKLHPHPNNPRKDLGDLTELAESIKAQGVLQNLTVVPFEDGYRIIIGHRRHSAAKLAGFTELPCAIVEMDERTQIGTMLLENIQRSDLTVLEQAHGFQLMLDLGETVAGISQKTGFSEATVRHRVKLNELDKKKLSEASMRGGRIEDYIALEKIKNEKTRNEVLETIGTGNFNSKLKYAIEEQEKPDRKKAMVAALNKFAKPIKENETSKYAYVTGYYDFKGKVEKPKDADKVEYFYTVDNYRATLYRKDIKQVKPEKMKAEKEYGDREAKMKSMAKHAYELRKAFILNFTAAKSHSSDIMAFIFRRLQVYGRADTDKLLKWIGVECKREDGEDYTAHWDRQQKLLDTAYQERPEYMLFLAAYISSEDGTSNDYYEARNWEKKILFQHNPRLDNLYDLLIALDYEMSDEEKQLRDGTHELFDKPVAAPAPDAPSGDNNGDGQDDIDDGDDFDDNAADGNCDEYFNERGAADEVEDPDEE
jgi:ParB family chromosome partitioning protein